MIGTNERRIEISRIGVYVLFQMRSDLSFPGKVKEGGDAPFLATETVMEALASVHGN